MQGDREGSAGAHRREVVESSHWARRDGTPLPPVRIKKGSGLLNGRLSRVRSLPEVPLQPPTLSLAIIVLAAAACTSNAEPADTNLRLEALSLTPDSVELSPGGEQQFGTSGTWSNGQSAPPSVSFTATGGTVSANGVYVAAEVPGAFRVIARHNDSDLSDTSAVIIVAPDPEGPPPAGGTILVQEGFEDNAAGSRGWHDNLAWTTTTDEYVTGGTRSLRLRWLAGQVLPEFGGTSRHLFAATSTLYVSYWVKYSPNWVGSGASYHPHEFQILTNASSQWLGPSFTNLTTYIEHRYTAAGGVPVLGMTDGANIVTNQVGTDLTPVTETRAVAGCNGNSDGMPTDCYPLGGGQYNNGKWIATPGSEAYFLPTAGPRYKADWHRVEVVLRLNTISGGVGQLDGVMEYWYDGVRVINQRNLLFRTGANPTMAWNQFIIGPYIGPGSPVTQSMFIDNLVIATAKP